MFAPVECSPESVVLLKLRQLLGLSRPPLREGAWHPRTSSPHPAPERSQLRQAREPAPYTKRCLAMGEQPRPALTRRLERQDGRSASWQRERARTAREQKGQLVVTALERARSRPSRAPAPGARARAGGPGSAERDLGDLAPEGAHARPEGQVPPLVPLGAPAASAVELRKIAHHLREIAEGRGAVGGGHTLRELLDAQPPAAACALQVVDGMLSIEVRRRSARGPPASLTGRSGGFACRSASRSSRSARLRSSRLVRVEDQHAVQDGPSHAGSRAPEAGGPRRCGAPPPHPGRAADVEGPLDIDHHALDREAALVAARSR